MALNYLELHSRLHKLSNKTKITQFGIRTREMHIQEVGTKQESNYKATTTNQFCSITF